MPKAKKLPSGSWRVQVYSHSEPVFEKGKPVVDSKTGKQKQKRIYESFTSDDPSPAGRREAEFAAAEFASNKNRKTRSRMTFGEALESYIASKENILSQASITGYKVIERNYISTIKDIRLDKFDRLIVQEWVNTISKKRSPKTIKNAYGLFSSVMAMFTDFRFKVQLPQSKPNKAYVPSDNDVKAVLGNCDDELRICIYLAAFAGLRRGEICGLTKKDIRKDYIIINKSVGMKTDRSWIIKEPKNISSNRNVNIPDFLISLLKNCEPLTEYCDEKNTIYHSLISLTPDHITDRFGVLVKKLGLTQFTFHDLRHYYVSINHALGIPDQYIMMQGGWSTDRTMKSVYRNIIDTEKEKFIQKSITHFENMQHEMQHETKKAP